MKIRFFSLKAIYSFCFIGFVASGQALNAMWPREGVLMVRSHKLNEKRPLEGGFGFQFAFVKDKIN